MKPGDQSSDYNYWNIWAWSPHTLQINKSSPRSRWLIRVHARTHGIAEVVAAGQQGAPEERLKPEDWRNVEMQMFDDGGVPELLLVPFMGKLKRMF